MVPYWLDLVRHHLVRHRLGFDQLGVLTQLWSRSHRLPTLSDVGVAKAVGVAVRAHDPAVVRLRRRASRKQPTGNGVRDHTHGFGKRRLHRLGERHLHPPTVLADEPVHGLDASVAVSYTHLTLP